MMPEDLLTECNIASMIQSNPMVKLASRSCIGVGMGGASWATAHPLLKVGGPTIGFGPPTFRKGPFAKFSPVFSPTLTH